MATAVWSAVSSGGGELGGCACGWLSRWVCACAPHTEGLYSGEWSLLQLTCMDKETQQISITYARWGVTGGRPKPSSDLLACRRSPELCIRALVGATQLVATRRRTRLVCSVPGRAVVSVAVQCVDAVEGASERRRDRLVALQVTERRCGRLELEGEGAAEGAKAWQAQTGCKHLAHHNHQAGQQKQLGSHEDSSPAQSGNYGCSWCTAVSLVRWDKLVPRLRSLDLNTRSNTCQKQ